MKKIFIFFIIILISFPVKANFREYLIEYYQQESNSLDEAFQDYIKEQSNTENSGNNEQPSPEINKSDQIQVSGQFWDAKLLEQQSQNQSARQEQIQDELNDLKSQGTTTTQISDDFDKIENGLLQDNYYLVSIKLNSDGNLGFLEVNGEYFIFVPYTVGENEEAMKQVLEELYQAQDNREEVVSLLDYYGIKYRTTGKTLNNLELLVGPRNGIKEPLDVSWSLDKHYSPQALKETNNSFDYDEVVLYTVFTQQELERETNQVDTSIRNRNQLFVKFNNRVPILGDVTYSIGWLPDALITRQRPVTQASIELKNIVHYPFYKSYIKLFVMIGLVILAIVLGVIIIIAYKKNKYDKVVEKTSDHDFL